MITLDELLAELRTPPDDADGWRTNVELQRAWKICDVKVRQILRAARDAGRLEHRRLPREMINGVVRHVDAYRIRPQGKKKKS